MVTNTWKQKYADSWLFWQDDDVKLIEDDNV